MDLIVYKDKERCVEANGKSNGGNEEGKEGEGKENE